MNSTNPYSAPQAPIGSDTDNERYQPQVLSFSGRIGRLRYLAYSIPWNLLAWVGFMVLGMISAVLLPMLVNGNGAGVGILGVLIGLVILAIAYVPMFGLSVRRLNDLNQSGWLSLILLIPLINLLFLLVLIFAPGTKSVNNYGPRPVENSGLVIFGALIFPLSFVFVFGVLAAIALPAYQDYVLRAQTSDAILQVQPVQDKVEVYAQEHQEFPAQNQDIDHSWRGDSLYVQSIDVATGGVITLVIESDNSSIQGKTVVFRPNVDNGFIEWDCTGGDLEMKHRPSVCRPL